MKKKMQVVIGAQYGDEGKGLITDYLSSKISDSMVCRFNGGAQASHSVVHVDNSGTQYRHAFRHIGSNSFLERPSTFLSEHFILEPTTFRAEREKLSRINVNLFIHEKARITTVFDVAINVALEEMRGAGRHGSCGLGVGETVLRSQVMGDSTLVAGDLLVPGAVSSKLRAIADQYFVQRLKETGLDARPELFRLKFPFLFQPQTINIATDFIYNYGSRGIKIVPDYSELLEHHNPIFEGAQGLLLSEDLFSETNPHTTWSKTGISNVLDIIGDEDVELEVFYVTRAYRTRHGNGPLTHELPNKPYKNINDPNNVPNPNQGSMRYGHLDLDELFDAVERDIALIPSTIDFTARLCITCMDQIDQNITFIHRGSERNMPVHDFVSYVLRTIRMYTSLSDKILLSFGPTRATVVEFAG